MKIFLILLLIISFNVQAQKEDMHDCALLPLVGAKSKLAFKLYDKIESYLKISEWCNYKINSSLIDVLKKYDKNVEEYLNDPEIIYTVFEKLKVGSLIKVTIKVEDDILKLSMLIYGNGGQELYLSKKESFNIRDEEIIFQTAKSWLEEFQAFIPYDGKILEVLGNSVNIKFPTTMRISEGTEFIIKRLIEKKEHRFLKTVVSYETETIASGEIIKSKPGMSVGRLKVYTKKNPIMVNDWVLFERKKIEENNEVNEGAKYKNFGSIGIVDIYGLLSSQNTNSTLSSSTKTSGGKIYGLGFNTEIWVTRNYFANFTLDKSLGLLNDIDNSKLRIAGGYKFLPMGFFYGPQINAYAGFSRYSFGHKKNVDKGIGTYAVRGVLAGVSGDVPFQKKYRAFIRGEILLLPTLEDEDKVYGSSKKISSFLFELGAKYTYDRRLGFVASLEALNNKAKLKGEPSEIKSTLISLKFGGSYTF